VVRVIRFPGIYRVIGQGGSVIVPVGVTHHGHEEEEHLAEVDEELVDARGGAL
jgi:hypothetical protein